MHGGYEERWEVSLGDVQGRMSSIHFWPSTLTCACIKIQVLRDGISEHKEVTPFLPVSQYEVRCNYRFSMYIPKDCTHIRMALISGDIHPITEKPKLIARSRLSFSEIRRHCPLHKYFSLYRWDPVTESNVPGGHIRIAFRCNHATNYFDEDGLECRSMSSMDRLSLCSFGRSDGISLTRSCESDIHSLHQRPATAFPRALYHSNSQQAIRYSSSTYSDAENTDSARTRTERTSFSGTFRREIVTPFVNPRSVSLDHHPHQLADDELNKEDEEKEQEDNTLQQREDNTENVESNKLSVDENVDRNPPPPPPQREKEHRMVWFGVILGTTLGIIGTVATITLRVIARRKPQKGQSGRMIVTRTAC